MRRPIGYYVHHHGSGHWTRARSIAPLLERPCTVIGTLRDIDDGATGLARLDLPDDSLGGMEGADGEANRPNGLHYAPVGSSSVMQRMARIAAWVEANDPTMMIVDVSVEVTLLSRLLSVPTVVVRLSGDRTDMPHLEAFRAAEELIAPFPAALEHPSTPEWVVKKTIYAGLLSAAARTDQRRDRRIVVLFGRGGNGGDDATLSAAARALPDHTWDVLGPVRRCYAELPPNLKLHGWVSDVGSYLAPASVVIGTGGDGVLAAAAAYAKPFVCIPEDRPFNEQSVKAAALDRLGVALYRRQWSGIDWQQLLDQAMKLDTSRLGAFARPDGPLCLAAALDAIASRLEHRLQIRASP